MNTPLNETIINSTVNIQGCAYKIENDRVIISINRICNNRCEGNISGSLRLQLCAFSQHHSLVNHSFNTSSPNNIGANSLVLASTTIGEINGQHFLLDCHYNLIFQQPHAGTWQFVLQLSEWDGGDYVLQDSVSFPAYYQTQSSALENIESIVNTKSTINMVPESTAPTSVDVVLEKVADTKTHQPSNPETKKKVIKKSATELTDNYLTINKSKAEKLLNIKGIPKKTLEKLIAERPFDSDKGIINVKGVGPKVLQKILYALMD